MNNKQYYLKPNVQIEPLFNQWYAWSHLIAPATAAMNIGNSHIKIMKSYIMAPEIHATAVKSPAMRGGPFLDFDSARVGEVKSFVHHLGMIEGLILDAVDGGKIDVLFSHQRSPCYQR